MRLKAAIVMAKAYCVLLQVQVNGEWRSGSQQGGAYSNKETAEKDAKKLQAKRKIEERGFAARAKAAGIKDRKKQVFRHIVRVC